MTKIPTSVRGATDTTLHDTALEAAAGDGLKTALARTLARTVAARGLTQAQVEALTGMAQTRVSKIVRGQLADISSEKLLRMLICLGHDIRLTIDPPTPGPGTLQVSADGESAQVPIEETQAARAATKRLVQEQTAQRTRMRERAEARRARLSPQMRDAVVPLCRDWARISDTDLRALADQRSLRQLSVEFGVSDVAIRKRLSKLGWISPRARPRTRRGEG